MDSTQLNYNPEEARTNYKKWWLFAGAGAILAGITLLTRKKIMIEETDPPPIIIKSGSFTIESNQDLTPPAPNMRLYHWRGFGKVRKIRVIYYNEIMTTDHDVVDFEENSHWDQNDQIQVNINLHGAAWHKLFRITENSRSLDFNTELNLSAPLRKGNPKRRSKRLDEENETFSFGLIEILNRTTGTQIQPAFNPVNGREYIIGLYSR